MKHNLTSLLGVLLLATTATLGANTGKEFRSVDGRFSITYPSSWRLFKDGGEVFEIINFSQEKMLKGVGLAPHGASIVVTAAPPGVNTLRDWITRDSAGADSLKGAREIHLSQVPSDGCTQLLEQQSDQEVGPKAYTHQVALYCLTKNRAYRVVLWYWKHDPHEAALRQTVLRIALSLRSW